MRRARLTFIGAYHHVVSRGYGGMVIFPDDASRVKFLEFLRKFSNMYNISVYAFTLMDNHYHLVLENSSGKLSEFMKNLNGSYGSYFRAKYGGKGYVFQGRFWSAIINGTEYLKEVISYILFNPVRAGMETDPFRYKWNSIYYGKDTEKIHIQLSEFLNTDVITEFFDSYQDFISYVLEYGERKLQVYKTRAGFYIGNLVELEKVTDLFDKRGLKKNQGTGKRLKEGSIKNAVKRFESRKEVNLSELEFNTLREKKIRGELLVYLRDRGFSYRKILQLPYFKGLKLSSLSALYRHWKKNLE